MYQVQSSGEVFNSFCDAVKVAAIVRSDVIEVATGLRRWTPAALVSKRRIRQYREQLAAYTAQQSK